MLHTKFRENRLAGSREERRFIKGFYHIWAWRPPWSCDLNAANKLWFPLPKEAQYKFSFGQTVLEKKRFKIVYDGRTLDHEYPISSPMSLRLR